MIRLSQEAYLDKILAKFNVENSKRCFIIMQHGFSLSKTQCPINTDEVVWMSKIPYALSIGSIMYAMI